MLTTVISSALSPPFYVIISLISLFPLSLLLCSPRHQSCSSNVTKVLCLETNLFVHYSEFQLLSPWHTEWDPSSSAWHVRPSIVCRLFWTYTPLLPRKVLVVRSLRLSAQMVISQLPCCTSSALSPKSGLSAPASAQSFHPPIDTQFMFPGITQTFLQKALSDTPSQIGLITLFLCDLSVSYTLNLQPIYVFTWLTPFVQSSFLKATPVPNSSTQRTQSLYQSVQKTDVTLKVCDLRRV